MPSRRLLVLAIVLVCVCFSGALRAQDSLNVTRVAAVDWPSRPQESELRDTLLYVTTETSGMYILNVRNPGAPVMVGRTAPFSDLSDELKISGNYAYATDCTAGLRIIDIANPAAPVEVGCWNETGMNTCIQAVAVWGNRALVTDYFHGFWILDLTTPAAPVLLGQVTGQADGTGGHTVRVRGDFAYFAASSRGLTIYNIANPAQPQLVGTLGGSGVNYSDLAWAGNYLCALDEAQSQLRILDVSDPAHPAQHGVADLTDAGWCGNLTVKDLLAYVMQVFFDLQVVNLANPAAPARVGSYHSGFISNGSLTIAGDYGYLCTSRSLNVLSLSNPVVPVWAAEAGVNGWAHEMAVSGHYAYLGDDYLGVRVFDLTDPLAPVETSGQVSYGSSISGLQIVDGLAYFVNRAKFEVWDVSFFPGQAISLAHLDLPTGGQDQVIVGRTAYVTAANGPNQNAQLCTIDISQPSHPVLLDALSLPGMPSSVDVADGFAYVAAQDSGLRVISVVTPEHTFEIGSVVLPETQLYSLARDGQTLYAGCNEGVVIFSLADPSLPAVIGRIACDARYVADLAVREHWLFLAGMESGLQVWDVADPAAPQQTGYYRTPRCAYDVDFYGNNVLVCDMTEFAVFDCSAAAPFDSVPGAVRAPREAPLEVALAPAYPNPFNSTTRLQFTLPAAGPVELGVFDVLGRRVATLVSGTVAAGTHERVWSADGLPSGLYLIQLQTATATRVQKALLVK